MNFMYDGQSFTVRRCLSPNYGDFSLLIRSFDRTTTSSLKSDVIFDFSTPICARKWLRYVFTRTWLRYVRVFAIANPSVSVVCPSSVCNVGAPTQGVEAFGNISSPLCTLAILWPPYKILQRSFQVNPSVGGVKRNRSCKIERWWTYLRLYLINSTRWTYSFY